MSTPRPPLPPFSPENALEEALVRAVHDPAGRPLFYRALRGSELYLLHGEAPEGEPEALPRRIPEGEEHAVTLSTWSAPTGSFIPIFSSRTRVQEAADKVKLRFSVLAMEGQAAFAMLAKGELGAVLNPGFGFGKQFLLEEIKAIADGSILGVKEEVLAKDTQMLIGQPATEPEVLKAALAKVFEGHAPVSAAWVAIIQDPASGEPPHLLVGVECDGELGKVFEEAGAVAQVTEHGGGPVDFIRVSPGPLDGYFRKLDPFYRRPAKPSKWIIL